MMFNNAITFRPAALMLVVFVLGACASQGGPVIRLQGDLTKIEKIAVLPYKNMTTIHGEGATIRSPINSRVFVTGPVATRADQFLTEQVVSRVQQDIAFKTVPARNANSILNAVADGKGRTWNRRMQLAETGRQLGADAIMVGHVYRFRERVGTSFAAASPASVSFDLYIIDCQQESVVWSAFYNYTQQALSDNLGGMGNFFRRGGRWVTAEELATLAIEDMFADLSRAYAIGWGSASDSPLDLFKMTVAEGGIRSPMLISGPGIKGDRQVNTFSYVWDIMPTVLELTGIPHPKKYRGRQVERMRGKSLKDVLKGLQKAA